MHVKEQARVQILQKSDSFDVVVRGISNFPAFSLPTSLTLNCGNVAEKREQDAAYLAVRATD